MQTEKQSIYRILKYQDIGIIDYQEAWDLQHKIFNQKIAEKIEDTLLLLEHPHTYTIGKGGSISNLVFSEEELKKRKISLYNIDRGGDITYHGPGQIVGYPIIDLKNWEQDTHKYLRTLEEVVIASLKEFGIVAHRDKEHTGVWIDDNKICAIGIKVSRWITMHGFALNVNTDMALFNGIIPCGITDKGVTSMEIELGKKIELSEMKKIIKNKFAEIFGYDFVEE